MEKKYFSIIFALFATFIQSQILTYVGNSALVTVQNQTLVYNGGGFQTAGTGTVNNYGNIMVKAAASDQLDIAGTSAFNLKLNSTSSYGQLYISGIPQGNITGKVNKEFRADANSGTTAKQQIALPYFNYTISDLTGNVANSSQANTGGNYFNVTNGGNTASGRFSPNSVFKWNNYRARFDQIAAASSSLSTTNVGTPLDYYIVPRRNASGTAVWDPANASYVTTFSGTPVSDVGSYYSFSLTGAFTGSFGYNGSSANYYGERYYSYLDDPFQSKTANGGNWDVAYGRNLYQVANPFMTNIDLKYIGQSEATNSDGNAIPNLQGVAYYTSGLTWVRQNGTTYPSENTTGGANGTAGRTVVMLATSGVFQTGDISAGRLVIKPMGEFMIKLSADNGAAGGATAAASKIDFTLLRHFASTSRNNATQTTNPSSKMSGDTDIPTDKIVKQLAVVMYDADSLEIARTYYAISPSSITGNSSGNTLMQSFSGSDYIYTKEELLQGGEDTNYSDKLYINEANETDFQTKKIPLFVNYTTTPYYLKFEVYEKGERVGADGLSSGKSFYIETENNVFTKINDGDNLPLTTGIQNLGLYYEKPENGTLGTNGFSNSQTVIAKKNTDWVVRFAKTWKQASVEVYSAAGQLISSKSNISTGSDYIIPLDSQVKSIYVVKAVSEKGEVVIKKIIN